MAHEDAAPDSVPEDRAPTEAEAARPAGPGRITRVVLKNYKSIVSCDVRLEPLTILVGPNGSGKSNFLDALSFVKQALVLGLDQALLSRGGFDRILSLTRPTRDDSFAIQLDLEFPSGGTGRYGFKVEQTADGAATVKGETLTLSGRMVPLNRPNLFTLIPDEDDAPDRTQDKFFLARHSDAPQIRSAYDLLTSMVFYNPRPDAMRVLKPRVVSPHLHSDGANVATMLRRMQQSDAELVWGITQYMKRVLPGLESIEIADLAGWDLLRLAVTSDADTVQHTFDADQLSDGTLRGLAILVALFQHRLGGKSVTSLVGIEEPENNLHPGVGGALANALIDASYDGQVLITTHSTALLDGDEIDERSLRAVVLDHGRTVIGPIDEVGRSVLRDRLFSAGDLLQQNQLLPDTAPADSSPEPATGDPAPVGS